jgi:catechol 2,3-dioxygenase-like lactoylglutathione lyase family enzyme
MIAAIDHVVLTTRDLPACVRFYTEGLGMTLETFAGDRQALKFGRQKINLHVYGRELEPKAHLPVPGSQDWCFLASVPMDEVLARLAAVGIPIVEGPVKRTGAQCALRSVYVRDPDLNLIEIAVPWQD